MIGGNGDRVLRHTAEHTGVAAFTGAYSVPGSTTGQPYRSRCARTCAVISSVGAHEHDGQLQHLFRCQPTVRERPAAACWSSVPTTV